MCQRVTCPRCGKYTYEGCGQHVDEVLGGLPHDQLCACGQDDPR